MPEFRRGDQRAAAEEERTYAALSDAELTERMRAGAPAVDPAVRELRRRHQRAVRTYAGLCAGTQIAGSQLATQAFTLAVQETERGIDPEGTWRHHLLMLVRRVAGTWAADSRRDRLDPGFVSWADETAGEGPSAMLGGFYRMPGRLRGVLWYSVVEEEPDTEVATFLGTGTGTGTGEVAGLRDAALEAMRQAYLRTYLERGGGERCQGFARIIEAAARPGDRRRSADLARHLDGCPGCTRALAQLTRMTESPQSVLADGLLGWGGAAYVAGYAAADRGPGRPLPPTSATPAASAAASARPGGGGTFARVVTRPVVLGTAAAVATAATIGVLLAAGSGERDPAGGGAGGAGAPPAAIAPTSSLPVPSGGASEPPDPSGTGSGSGSEEPTRSADPGDPSVTAPAGPPSAPGHSFTQVVNTSSGLCLDIEGGVLDKRTDVVTNECGDVRTQQWRLDARGLLHTYADLDFCLDTRGDSGRRMGIGSCSSVNGDQGENLLFTIERSGLIRPKIAPDFAVTPVGVQEGSQVVLSPATGRGDQQWAAGASPTG